MDAIRLVDSLDRFGRILPAVVVGLHDEDARWKPPSGAWSILEVVCHLADEEVDDFRTRLDLTLRDPSVDWPPNNPEAAAVERRYNEQDLLAAVERFVRERQQSVAWLQSLKRPDWNTGRLHPQARTLRAGDLLTSWAAHDALHLRQIAKRLFELTGRDGGTFQTRYAGEW